MSVVEAVLPHSNSLETQEAVIDFQDKVRGFSPDEEMKMLGISSDFELQRYRAVAEVAGHGLAMREVRRNVAAYEKEFIRDIPISDPHPYYHINGKLHSEDIDHPLFGIEAQIDGREREGRTLNGFKKFQDLVTRKTNSEEMVVWYSPAGVAGNQPPFSNIYFDSGRLYLAFKNAQDFSQHVDIKVDESRFPIRELLDWINYISGGDPVSADLSTNEAGYYYLEHPMNLQIPHQEFSRMLYDFAEKHRDQVVYTSQRDSLSAHSHRLHDIFSSLYNGNPLQEHAREIDMEPFGQGLTQQQIQEMYLLPIVHQMQQNGGTITLYGCSTTSVLSQSSSSNLIYTGAGDLYSTWGRLTSSNGLLGSQTSSEKKWSYHEGDCQKCPAKKVDVGPCSICKKCEKLIDEEERAKFVLMKLMEKFGLSGIRIV